MSEPPIYHNLKAIFHVETSPFRKCHTQCYFKLSLTSSISLGFPHHRKGPRTGLQASAFFLINCLVDLEYNGIFLGSST